MYPQVFDAAREVDQAFAVIIGFSIFILICITVLMVWFLWRYHHTRHPDAEQIEGHVGAEIAWTVIPLCIVMALFWFGWRSYSAMRAAPADAMQVEVTSRMWSWTFTYADGKRSNVLMAPRDRAVKLNMTSKDVIHSFYVPAMRIKMDTVPGMQTHVWFRSDETGEFDILCAEYCGLKHANMISTLKVVEPEEFEAWLGGGAEAAQKGLALLDGQGCTACHTMDGGAGDAPTLQGVAGRETVVLLPGGGEKSLAADEAYLRRSILDPGSEIVRGYDDIMPPYEGAMTDEDLSAIVAFLLQGAATPPHPGRAMAQAEGCISCHSTDGSIIEGPSFKELFGSQRTVLEGGEEKSVVADEAYLRESILHPDRKVSKGFDDLMPPYDYFSEEETATLVDYIRSLGETAQ